MDNSPFLSVGVDPRHTDITQAIRNALQHDVHDTHCQRCGTNQTKTRWTEIVAAPKVLRIQLQIMLYNQKLFHALDYPDVLDLTAFQQTPGLPLEYGLSSVVAHAGDFVSAGEADEEANEQLIKQILEEEEEEEETGSDEEGDKGSEDEEEGSEEEHQSSKGTEASSEHDATDTKSTEQESTESDELDRAMDSADPSDPTADNEPQAQMPPGAPKKVMLGHYIASVREPDGKFSTINDSGMQSISHNEFLSNPQRSEDREFQVYILTYIRDDSVRRVPCGSRRWFRETARLTLGGFEQESVDEEERLRRPWVEGVGKRARGSDGVTERTEGLRAGMNRKRVKKGRVWN